MKTTKILMAVLLVLVAGFLLISCSNDAKKDTTSIADSVANVVDDVEEEITQPVRDVVESLTNDFEVTSLGEEGFDNAELEVEVGDVLTFVNKDVEGKDMVVTFQLEDSRKFITSDVVKLGNSWEYSFEEAGTYTFWVVGYGVQGTIVVE